MRPLASMSSERTVSIVGVSITPRGAVVLDHTRIGAHVNDAARILDDGPVLTLARDLPGAIVADERAPFLRVRPGRGAEAGAACRAWARHGP